MCNFLVTDKVSKIAATHGHKYAVVCPFQEDDDIEEGDLPEHKRSPPPIDFSKVDSSKPEELLKMSKKGKTLMVFATVSGDPKEKETEEITGLWQSSLFNANFDIQRYNTLWSLFVMC